VIEKCPLLWKDFDEWEKHCCKVKGEHRSDCCKDALETNEKNVLENHDGPVAYRDPERPTRVISIAKKLFAKGVRFGWYNWISKEEYDESGPAYYSRRKCF